MSQAARQSLSDLERDRERPAPWLLARLLALPRAMQWGLWAMLVLGAYFLIVEPVLDRTGDLGGRASAVEASLKTYASSKARLDAAVNTARLGERQFGRLALPGDASKRSTEFSEALDQIMRRHDVTNVTSSSRTTQLERGPLVDLARAGGLGGGSQKVERIVKDLGFQATPEQLARVLADLEKEPLVTTISRVNARQTDGQDRFNRMLRVSIAVETWVVARK